MCGFTWKIICLDLHGKLYVWIYIEIICEDLYGNSMRGFVWTILCGSLWEFICVAFYGKLYVRVSMEDFLC